MAVWADIDEDDEASPLLTQASCRSQHHVSAVTVDDEADRSESYEDPASYVAQALRCYPVSERLANYLDLNDLSALSSTCRSVHDALVQFAHQLKQHSLRCAFEITNKKQEQEDSDTAYALQLSLEDQLTLGGNGPAMPVDGYYNNQSNLSFGSAFTGQGSKCARDLVSPCRKCGIVVCRNCIEKAPSNRLLPGRLRRLCDSCLEAPLILHKASLTESTEHTVLTSSASSTRSDRSDSTVSEHSDVDYHPTMQALAEIPEIWLRDSCTCATQGVYLCHQCGHANHAADNIYQRVWKWRSRYSTHLGGGLGTGLGLGNQGQKCGRDKHCLATRDAMALMEAECSSEDVSTPGGVELTRSNTPSMYDTDSEARPEPGYFRQEIEGVGGKVKSKSRKLVKVGATVYEFRDERESGKYLSREMSGELRSWCSWCSRVCPGKHDK